MNEEIKIQNEIEPEHDFTRKLRQEPVFGRIKEYIEWQKLLRRARAENKALPEIPKSTTPISINLDITTACNYSCDHCVDLDILNLKINYDYRKLLDSLRNLIEHGLKSVILIGGGEPTLHPKFSEVVRFLKENNLQVAIVSNGSRNNIIYDISNCLSGNDWVRLSLDSGYNDTFVRMHNPKKGTRLDTICSWIPKIRARNQSLSIGFSFIVTWKGAVNKDETAIIPNIDEMIPATKLARNFQFSYISFKPFLTRFPDSTEVLNPSAIADFKDTVERISQKIEEAKKYQSDKFKVIESTNLTLLKNGSWQNFTHQPKTCHMQIIRQVLSPLGLFNCPAYRGVERARIGDKDSFAGGREMTDTQQSIAGILDRFDASHECANITCLYNPANWWLEKAIGGELDPHELQSLPDRNDYFM